MLGVLGSGVDLCDHAGNVLDNLVHALAFPVGCAAGSPVWQRVQRNIVVFGQDTNKVVFLVALPCNRVGKAVDSVSCCGTFSCIQSLACQFGGSHVLYAVSVAGTNALHQCGFGLTLYICTRQVGGVVADDFGKTGRLISVVGYTLCTLWHLMGNREHFEGSEFWENFVVGFDLYKIKLPCKVDAGILGSIKIHLRVAGKAGGNARVFNRLAVLCAECSVLCFVHHFSSLFLCVKLDWSDIR